MKLKHTYLYLAWALLAAGCSESQEVVDNPNATPGEEVQFGGTLATNEVNTRTIYGDKDADNTSYPVYWVQDDKVIVTSPQCLTDYNNREYRINVESETQNYATGSLQKTADTGIRWSNDANATADFYSIYPSKNAVAADANLTKFKLTMPAQQTIVLRQSTDGKGLDYANADMDACFMWAKAPGVQSGSTVNLQYNPFSTALRFTLQGPQSNGSEIPDPVSVTKVVIEAANSTAIVGDFNVDLRDATTGQCPAVSDLANSGSSVTLVANYENGTHLLLASGETAELNAFIIPQEYSSVKGWKISVTVSTGITYTKTIAAKDLAEDNALKPGMVHDLGTLPYLSEEANWDPKNWMINIDDPVYLSEVSIPGSWNSLNSNFQSNTNIDAQYKAGCRAFHLDTRWRSNKEDDRFGNIYNASDADVGDLSVADDDDTYMMKQGSIAASKSLGHVMVEDNPTFATRLQEITDNVKSDEYMVVLCTFAQGSYKRTDKTWIEAISEACASNGKVVDARTINNNTTVGEMDGKVIVIILTDDENATLPSGSHCLLTYMKMEQDDPLAATNRPLNNSSSNANLMFYGTHAQITSEGTSGVSDSYTDRGYAPTIDERKTVAEEILTYSKNNYSPNKTDYDHNEWLYLGLGGYYCNSNGNEQSDTSGSVASVMKTWIEGKIDEMQSAKYYYPVGIVLMNNIVANATTAKDILLLNAKYEQAKKSGTQQTTSTNVNATSQSTYTNGGNAISY